MLTLPSLHEIDVALAERSLAEFTRQAWPIVEPATRYSHNWHIDAISDHLEAVSNGEIHDLIINIPPRCMKSLLTCVMWPTWTWAHYPESRWMFLSYDQQLSTRDSLKCRRIIQSAWYQQRWGHVFQLSGDQNMKTRFENDKAGFRMSSSTGGGATGEGGQFVVVDDPLKADDANSPVALETVNTWWGETMSTRSNEPKSRRRVIIMQRLHDRDLVGYVLEKMQDEEYPQYELLCLPMEYEPHRCRLTTGWEDPRTEPGELLWPERYDAKENRRLHAELGETGYSAQMQQRPVPAGGSIFKAAWWEGERNRYVYHDAALKTNVVARWQFWDTALKDKENNDFSACITVELLADYRLLIRHVWQEKLTSNLLPGEIERLAMHWNRDGKLRGVIVEDKGSGTTAIQTLRASAPEWLAEMILEFQPTGTKEYRAKQAAIWCDRDCVLLPFVSEETPWLFDFADHQLGQLFRFPAAKHDDMVDTFTMAIIYLEHMLAEGWRTRIRGNNDQ
jgi:phage terminase large subunit-like protein